MGHDTTARWPSVSGSGKSTLSDLLQRRFQALGLPVEVLDGDVVRTQLSSDLGFSREDRNTNIRRIIWVCEVLNRHGVNAIVAAISPYRETREEARSRLDRFCEVYVECPLEVLAAHDPKGLYGKALRGDIAHFTGISDPYEPPLHADVICHTAEETVEKSEAKILRALADLWVIPANGVGA